MPKHIILTDVALNLEDVIVVPRTAVPQIIADLEPGEYTVRNTSPPRSGTVREVTVPPIGSAPTITAQPTISRATATVGQSATLNFGTATGNPTPTRSWTLMRGAVDVSSQVVGNQIVFTTAGTYTLRVTWTNSAGVVESNAVSVVVAAAPAWQITAGENQLTITTMPSPPALLLTGGENQIVIGG